MIETLATIVMVAWFGTAFAISTYLVGVAIVRPSERDTAAMLALVTLTWPMWAYWYAVDREY